jgi:hypothetical protein
MWRKNNGPSSRAHVCVNGCSSGLHFAAKIRHFRDVGTLFTIRLPVNDRGHTCAVSLRGRLHGNGSGVCRTGGRRDRPAHPSAAFDQSGRLQAAGDRDPARNRHLQLALQRPGPCWSTHANVASISCSPARRPCATASALAVRASSGRAPSLSPARLSGRSWTPPSQMLKRRPDLPRFMPGGPENPMGARALYLGSSLYRIHGSNEPETIGQAVSHPAASAWSTRT